MAHFWELMRCAGVDEDASPFPGMVVPFGGSNIVVLDTGGKKLDVPPNQGAVHIEEFDATDLRKKLIETNIALSQPGVDKQFREAMMPTSLFWYDKPRFFRIHGKKHTGGFPGVKVEAKSGNTSEAALHVVVVDKMTIKIAIRNVRVRDAGNNPAFHAKQPCDPVKEHNGMNAVWGPQTNMIFDLVSPKDAIIDMQDKATRVELGKGFGLNDPDSAVFPPEVSPEKMEAVFARHKVSGAHLTFFLVDKLNNSDSGFTLPSGMAFIAGTHGPTTFAHEAGHFLGGSGTGKGAWTNKHHTYDKNPDIDVRMLMRDGGAGWKIPFAEAERFRGFLNRFGAR